MHIFFVYCQKKDKNVCDSGLKTSENQLQALVYFNCISTSDGQ